MALFAFATYLSFTTFGGIDWLNITMGEYELMNEERVNLIPSIGVSWIVGVDALSLPMVWLTALLSPLSMLVEWDAKEGQHLGQCEQGVEVDKIRTNVLF